MFSFLKVKHETELEGEPRFVYDRECKAHSIFLFYRGCCLDMIQTRKLLGFTYKKTRAKIFFLSGRTMVFGSTLDKEAVKMITYIYENGFKNGDPPLKNQLMDLLEQQYKDIEEEGKGVFVFPHSERDSVLNQNPGDCDG